MQPSGLQGQPSQGQPLAQQGPTSGPQGQPLVQHRQPSGLSGQPLVQLRSSFGPGGKIYPPQGQPIAPQS